MNWMRSILKNADMKTFTYSFQSQCQSVSQLQRRIRITFFVWLLIKLLFSYQTNAAVIVSPATSGTCKAVTPLPYSEIGNIVISEAAMTDFASPQTNATFILTAPANFQFNPGIGTVSFQAGRNITSASIAVTSTTITVTFSVSGTNKLDKLTISNVQARGLSMMAAGQILRTSAGGTAIITGDNPGAGVNHGDLTSDAGFSVFTTAADGLWSSPATWSGGVVPPVCPAVIVIAHTVTADIAANAKDLTITMGGNLVSTQPVTVSGLFTLNAGATYTHNNNQNANNSIFAGTENFDPASTIIVNDWYNKNVPFAIAINSDFGNITFSSSLVKWNQKGMFAPDRIKGVLTVSAGSLIMDGGEGMTTLLNLNDVVISGTGAIQFQAGSNRDYTLTTGNFTDNSTNVLATSILYRSHGVLNWTVNGNLSTSHQFNGQLGTTGIETGSTNIQINGDLNISGGNFGVNRVMNGPATVTVTGNTNISGDPGFVRFNETGAGNVTFSTTDLNITGGAHNEIIGGSNPTGSAVVNIAGDFYMNGANSIFYFIRNQMSTGTLQLTVGRDLKILRGSLRLAQSDGIVNASVGRDIYLSSTSSIMYGQFNSISTVPVSVFVGRNFSLADGVYYQTAGLGNITLNVTDTLKMVAGKFYGTTNPAVGNYGIANITIGSLDFDNGILYFHDNNVTDGRTVIVNCLGDFKMKFYNNLNRVVLVNQAGVNNAGLSFTVGGNFISSGLNNDGYFLSSASSGDEYFGVSGLTSISGGDIFFTGTTLGYGNSHNSMLSLFGDLIVNGGNLTASAIGGNAVVSVTGNVLVSAGNLDLKWDTGKTDMIVMGNYTQTGGTVNFHSRNSVTADSVMLTIFGNFSQSGGILNFDSYSGNDNPENYLNFYGTSYTVGGTGIITHANHLSSFIKFGNILFARNGIVNYSRTSSAHEIRQVRQLISGESTLNVNTSIQPLQIASHASSARADRTTLVVNGVLNMGTQQIVARSQANYYSGVSVNEDARIRTAHTGGLYSGSSAPSTINAMISGLNRMDYYLDPLSTVEYCGTVNQAITGIPNGIATTNDHKYGILEINHQGTPDVNYVFPEAANEVYVRTTLSLERGELNLDSDHNPSNGGGRPITMEDYSSIIRNTGYIRSETEDGSGLLRWSISNPGGLYEIPFGYNSSEYIPFIYAPTSGITGTLSVGTYHTLPNNVTYPPGVLHVNSLTGTDNSASTVDRFWSIHTTGSPVADITFNATLAEVGSILNLRAQRWLPANNGWESAQGFQTNPTPVSTLASGLPALGTWWTLSSSTSPLPVELSSFNARCINDKVKLEWSSTAEVNNDYFTIEKQEENGDLISIANIKGNGTTSSAKYYSFIDNLISNQPVIVYRLSQTDFNGQQKLLSTIRVNNCKVKNVITVHQQESASGIVLNINSTHDSKAQLRVFDLNGKTVIGRTIHVSSGIQSLTISERLAAGIYLVKIDQNEEQVSCKVISTDR